MTVVREIRQNLCTCGAHPAAACECDSSHCDGGVAFIGDDGSLWHRLPDPPEDQRAAILQFAKEPVAPPYPACGWPVCGARRGDGSIPQPACVLAIGHDGPHLS